MPNYITNKLTILGEQEEILRLVDFVKSEQSIFDFNRIIPKPKEISKSEDSSLICEWNTKNWGTKWHAMRFSQSWSFDQRTFHFETAWSPPLPIIKRLSELFNLFFNLDWWDEGDRILHTNVYNEGVSHD